MTLGVLMGMSRLIARIADPWIAALYPLPKIALIPLLVIWLGTGEVYKIVISASHRVLSDRDQHLCRHPANRSGLDQGGGGPRRQSPPDPIEIVIPAAIPSIFAGFTLAWGLLLF